MPKVSGLGIADLAKLRPVNQSGGLMEGATWGSVAG
jgi:hypothetical protein